MLIPKKSGIDRADHGEGMPVERHALSHRLLGAAELALREARAHRGHGRAPAHVIAVHERAPRHGAHAEDREEVAAHPRARHAALLTAVRKIEVGRRVRERAGEQAGRITDLFPERVRELVAAGAAHCNGHQLFGVAHRQRLEDERVREREDRAVRADAQREREHGDDSEARRRDEAAHRVAHIGEQGVEPAEHARVA